MSSPEEVFDRMCSPQWAVAEAVEHFRDLQFENPAIDVALLEYVRSNRPQWIRRALEVLSHVEGSPRLAPALLALLASKDAYVRAQSALLFARARPNAAWVESMLEHPDARVRANVIEGIRGACRDVSLIHRAIQDTSSRVRANALLLLYDVSTEAGLQALQRMLASSECSDRASACWACGETRDSAAIDLVKPLRSDENANVRWNALRALARLHRASRDKYSTN